MNQAFADLVQWGYLGYFVCLNGGYLLLIIISFFSLNRYMPTKVLSDLPRKPSGLDIPVSILMPAYNEEPTIAGSLKSMLQLNYPNYEIIVINDGSKDKTLEVLKREFHLVEFPVAYHAVIPVKPIRGFYRSKLFHNLSVIDKENGGKADSLNAGINGSRFPLFLGVDADTVLQQDSLQRIVAPFVEDRRVIATGGTVRLANGCVIQGGKVIKVSLPTNWLAMLQVVEYLRAFLFGRQGWSVIQALLIISGAFGVFKKDIVLQVGGYRTDTVGEDMELIVRMHRHMRKQKLPYRVQYLADPVAWTEAPEDIQTLRNQRIRWQRGLGESLFGNLRLMFSLNGGPPGWIAFPFMLIFEFFGPIFELVGFILMIYFWYAGLINWPIAVLLLIVAFGLGLLLSVSGLLLEEISFQLYKKPQQLAKLLLASLLENFGYRQINSYWRVIGVYRWMKGGKGKWGEMKRKGLGT